MIADGSDAQPSLGQVVVIDDDDDLLTAQVRSLKVCGFAVIACSNAPDALRHLSKDFNGAVISDVRMPGMDGLVFLERARALDPEIPVLLLTGHGDVSMAVDALRNGAYDFLTKPFAMDKLVASLRQAVSKRHLIIENRHLRALATATATGGMSLIGDSPIMEKLRDNLVQIADAEVDVLFTGDTGTGKETAARTLHRLSRRRNKPFVKVNCASLAEGATLAELFGEEMPARAAHLSSRRTIGRLERANKGFVLLDEVEALSPLQQASLLDVVETRKVWAIGAEEPRDLDIRIVATTKRDLQAGIAEGWFRADLFYRLGGVNVLVPPLAQRRSDVPLLFQHFLVRSAAHLDRPVPHLTERVHAHLQTHDWPGNVRELERFAERFALGLDDGSSNAAAPNAAPGNLLEAVAAFEATLIHQALRVHHGRVGATAQALGLARKTLYDKLARYQIALGDYRVRSDAEGHDGDDRSAFRGLARVAPLLPFTDAPDDPVRSG